MRYFFHIGYNGTNYSGWQKHAGVVSIQKLIEHALSHIFKFPITINGCGRTDAHVHASQFFFHADIIQEWNFDLLFRLNKILPDDIAVFDIIPMQGRPHARFDAIQRSYDYFMHTYKDPFLSKCSSLYQETSLNLDEMKKAVALLPLYDDYRCYCKMPDRLSNTICKVSSAFLFVNEKGNRLQFSISANRFLSKMIRIIVGRLLEIGLGNLSVDEFEHYLANKETPKIIIPAHPQGLYLSKVTYPYLNLAPQAVSMSFTGTNNDTTWQKL